MKKTYSLTDVAMEAFRFSDAFMGLTEDQANHLEEYLYDTFGGANAVDKAALYLRLDRIMSQVQPADEANVRTEILRALRAPTR